MLQDPPISTATFHPTPGLHRDAERAPGVLYSHQKRPRWGVGIRVGQQDGRIVFQFEDGKIRRISKSFLHLLREVDRPADEAARLHGELATRCGLTRARRQNRERLEEVGAQLITVEQQVQLFEELYPEGFADPKWCANVRGEGTRRQAKGHREPALREAAALLSEDAMRASLAAGLSGELVAKLLDLLDRTSLVTSKQLEPMRCMDSAQQAAFVQALNGWLHEPKGNDVAWLRLLQPLRGRGRSVSWPLVTALGALAQPDTHVYVRPSVFLEQARWLAPRLTRITREPEHDVYVRVQGMCVALMKELRERGHEPRDLFDAYDFIWYTLRPAGRKRIAELPPPPEVSRTSDVFAVAPTSADDDDASVEAA